MREHFYYRFIFEVSYDVGYKDLPRELDFLLPEGPDGAVPLDEAYQMAHDTLDRKSAGVLATWHLRLVQFYRVGR